VIRGELLGGDPEARLQHALDLAYGWLAQRDRTVAELRHHLEAKRVEPRTIEDTVAELLLQGYLDDAGYARRFTEDRRNLDGWGADRIARCLRALGVPDELVEHALGGREHGDELEAALQVLRRRVRIPPEDDAGRERALGMRARRGYDLDLAYEAVRRFEHDG
jgi:regulatory protein